jgi:hypothetical protein
LGLHVPRLLEHLWRRPGHRTWTEAGTKVEVGMKRAYRWLTAPVTVERWWMIFWKTMGYVYALLILYLIIKEI